MPLGGQGRGRFSPSRTDFKRKDPRAFARGSKGKYDWSITAVWGAARWGNVPWGTGGLFGLSWFELRVGMKKIRPAGATGRIGGIEAYRAPEERGHTERYRNVTRLTGLRGWVCAG